MNASPKLAADIGDPWAEIAKATARYQEIYLAHDFLERRAGSISQLYGYARVLVRGAAERTLPNTERLPEFSDDNLPLAEKNLIDPRPVYPDLERIGLDLWLKQDARVLDRRQRARPAPPRQRVAVRTRRAAGGGHSPRRPGGAGGALEGRPGGHRRVE